MQVSDQGVVALMQHEGIVPAPYLDSVGVWTYGIGHTAAAGAPDPAKMPRGMPADLDGALEHVAAVFCADLARYTADVLRAVKVPLAQHELDALVSFHINTGAIVSDKAAEWVKSNDASTSSVTVLARAVDRNTEAVEESTVAVRAALDEMRVLTREAIRLQAHDHRGRG